MYKKLFLLPLLFLSLVVLFVVSKLVFMLYYHELYAPFSSLEYLNVLLHGLKHDASIAGYLTTIPALLLLLSCWFPFTGIRYSAKLYFGVVSALVASILTIDLILYEYWGFRLDSSPLFYILSPREALASTSVVTNIAGFISAGLIALGIYKLTNSIFGYRPFHQPYTQPLLPTLAKRSLISIVVLLQTGLLFLAIRGGVKESTMNVGKVYFSNEIVLNHAAINPAFSLFESLSTLQQFDKQYRFLPDAEATQLFGELTAAPASDSIPRLFTIERPNVIFVILESFMSLNLTELGGIPDVAVNLDSLARKSLLFTNLYANSFRTDRALVSLMSAFPAQPVTSLMKYPRKLQQLPNFPMEMKKQGYDIHYLYGGDADFTSMRSYLRNCGFERITEDVSFPAEYNTTKWGVPDEYVFDRLYHDIANQTDTPFLKVIQTQSSHHPFDVPYRGKLDDPYLNSVAYTDSCLGDFVERLRRLPAWDNTILVLVPDHAMRYPYDLDNRSVERYKIPMIIAGGALKLKGRIDQYASQTDIAATLLYQLGIDHSGFVFSKNILNPDAPHFGFFTFTDGFGMVSQENEYVYDNESKTVTTNSRNENFNEKRAQAYIQKLYDIMNQL